MPWHKLSQIEGWNDHYCGMPLAYSVGKTCYNILVRLRGFVNSLKYKKRMCIWVCISMCALVKEFFFSCHSNLSTGVSHKILSAVILLKRLEQRSRRQYFSLFSFMFPCVVFYSLKSGFLYFSLHLVEDDHWQFPYVIQAHTAGYLWGPIHNSWSSVSVNQIRSVVYLWCCSILWLENAVLLIQLCGWSAVLRKKAYATVVFVYFSRKKIHTFYQNHRRGSCHLPDHSQIKIKINC